MEALTNLSTKMFTKTCHKALSPSRFTLLGRSDIGFSRSPGLKNLQFNHLILFGHKNVPLVTKSLVASNAEVLRGFEDSGFEDSESGIPNIQPSKKVHLKFQLQKECMFGEQFLLVGDDPMIGWWDPSNAIPLNWSDGHMWSVELDVFTNSTIQYKFVLKTSKGEILWQPGPDRTFKTWECNNTIVIAEDWENAEAQKITEELSQVRELVINPELEPSVAGNVTQQREGLMPDVNKDVEFSSKIVYAEDESNINIELTTRESITYPVEGHQLNANKELKSKELAGNNREDPTKNNNQRTQTGKNAITVDDEKILFKYEESPVLIPGLIPLQAGSTEEKLSKELGSMIADASVGVDAAKSQNMPEVTSG